MLILTSIQNACQVLLLLLFIGTGVFFRVQDLYSHSRVENGSLTSAQGHRLVDVWTTCWLEWFTCVCTCILCGFTCIQCVCLAIIRFISHVTALKGQMAVWDTCFREAHLGCRLEIFHRLYWHWWNLEARDVLELVEHWTFKHSVLFLLRVTGRISTFVKTRIFMSFVAVISCKFQIPPHLSQILTSSVLNFIECALISFKIPYII